MVHPSFTFPLKVPSSFAIFDKADHNTYNPRGLQPQHRPFSLLILLCRKQEFQSDGMARLKGIEASVVIDGRALTEYDDEDTPDESSDHTSEVSKYIEAVSDAEFSISVTVPNSHKFAGDALSFRLSLDGIWVKTWLCRKAKIRDLREDWHANIAGSEVGNGKKWCLRPFKFNDIKTGKTSLQKSTDFWY